MTTENENQVTETTTETQDEAQAVGNAPETAGGATGAELSGSTVDSESAIADSESGDDDEEDDE